jgi:hypothetical protein
MRFAVNMGAVLARFRLEEAWRGNVFWIPPPLVIARGSGWKMRRVS